MKNLLSAGRKALNEKETTGCKEFWAEEPFGRKTLRRHLSGRALEKEHPARSPQEQAGSAITAAWGQTCRHALFVLGS